MHARYGRAPAADVGGVHRVVVDEGGYVEQLDRRRHHFGFALVVRAEGRGEQRHGGPHALAGGAVHMRQRAGEEGEVDVGEVGELRFHPVQPFADGGVNLGDLRRLRTMRQAAPSLPL